MAKRQSTLPTWFASTSGSSPKKAKLTGFCNYLVFYELVSTFCFMDLFVLLLYGLFNKLKSSIKSYACKTQAPPLFDNDFRPCLVSVLFAASLLLFSFFMFFVLFPVLFCNYILCIKNNIFNTHAGVPRQPYEGCFMHEEAYTNVRFISCDEYQLYERGVDLVVEGVRYIEMHRGPAAYVLGPAPSRSRHLELESGVNACHVEYVYESRDSHVRGTE